MVKTFGLFIDVTMILVLLFFVFPSPASSQTPPPTVPTLYVDINYQGSDPDWFNKIQDAVEAGESSMIIVYPGTYHENVEIGEDRMIHLIARSGPSVTIIDGDQNGPGVTFFHTGPGCEIDGFTIRNGTGRPYSSGGTCGGGIYCENSSPEIKNNVIRHNTVEAKGGGIFCTYEYTTNPYPCAPIITQNQIHDNTAGNRGGGICCYAIRHPVTITDNNIYNNTAEGEGGGGIYISGNNNAAGIRISVVKDNNIQYNRADSSTLSGQGGGLLINGFGWNKVVNNRIRFNTASNAGGGMYIRVKSGGGSDRDILDRNFVFSNTAEYNGGGIYLQSVPAILTNNAVSYNNAKTGDGGGVYAEGGAATQFTNNSVGFNKAVFVSEGTGGGIYLENGTGVRIENCIVYGNMASQVNQMHVDGGSAPAVQYSDVESESTPGVPWPDPSNTNIWLDPLFIDMELHISSTSPCKDRGDNSATCIPGSHPEIPAWDYDGESRIFNSYIVEMGSDEVQE